ncbi:MAG: hypothetical protein GY932_15165, partial [Arcobacter sp.]|nr:hypothetical protein [Arcobacter sp.]
MEIIFYISATLIGLVFLFLIIEYPYYLIGGLFFLVHYKFNLDLPGPLDLRGVFILVFFLRLIVFDKDNLKIINKFLFTNQHFVLILIFGIYFISVTYIRTDVYKLPIRLFIFQIVGLLLAFVTVYNGHAKKAFLSAIIVTGVLSTADLVLTYFTSGHLFVTRFLDVLIKSEYSTEMNHNFFGMLIGIAFITVYMISFTQKTKKIFFYSLFAVFALGIIVSTSRGTMLAVLVSVTIGTIIFPEKRFDPKKVIFLGIKLILFFSIVIFSYSYIMTNMNIKSKFANQIYYRLVEEPMSIFDGKVTKYKSNESKKEGTIRWRLNKAQRDLEEFSIIPSLPTQFFGFGYNGYYNISETLWLRGKHLYQYAAHNGYVILIIERGII